MTAAPSIFLKVCPACAGHVPTAAEHCDCGHEFEATADQYSSPEELALRDEELYENYLIARAEQAREAARAAETAYYDHPDHPDLVAAAALARDVANSIESDLAAQCAKVSALRDTVNARRPRSPAVSTFTATSLLPVIAENAAHLPDMEISSVSLEASVEAAPPPPAASLPASPIVSAQKAAGVLTAIKQAKARETAALAQKALKAIVARKQQDGKHIPPDFREKQAARAERIMEVRRHKDSRECPNCTASLPLTTTRCRCGFSFQPDGNNLPTLTLCTGDFTELRNSLLLNLRGRT